MWIKDLNIKAFGSLKDYAITFSSGFNQMVFDNEFGKTTSIEAIKRGLYGFSKVKNYEYLPNDFENIDFNMGIQFSDSDLLIERKHLGERASGKIIFEDKNKGISNKPAIPIYAEIKNLEIPDLDSNLLFLDSNSLEEHRTFLSMVEDRDISYIDMIDYKGPTLDSVKSDIKNEMEALYTNNRNSKSEFRRNELEIEEITALITRLKNDEEEKAKNYKLRQDLVLELKSLENEIADMEAKLKKSKDIVFENDLKSRYLKLISERREKSYDTLGTLPSYDALTSLESKIESLSTQIEERESELDSIGKTTGDKRLIDLCEYSNSQNLSLKRTFKALLSSFEVDDDIKVMEKNLASEVSGDLRDIDVDLVKEQIESYKKLGSSEPKLNYRGFSLTFIVSGIVSTILFFIGLAFDLDIFISMIFLLSAIGSIGYYLVLRKKDRDAKGVLKKNFEFAKGGMTSELQKIVRAKDIIFSGEKISYDAETLIMNTLREVSEYKKIRKENEGVKIDLDRFFNSHKDISYFTSLARLDQVRLAESFIDRSDTIILNINRGSELESKLEDLRQDLSLLESERSSLLINFETNLGTIDYSEIQSLRTAAEANRREMAEILNAAKNKEIDLESPLKEVEQSALESDLKALREKRVSMVSSIEGLRVGLENSIIIPNHKYSFYNHDELLDLRSSLRARNLEIMEKYNSLLIEAKLISDMENILKSKMQPSYIGNANSYYKKIAPDTHVSIGVGDVGVIAFVDSRTGATLPFSSLSTGVQAQVVLSLKLSYLKEKDPECHYPLIIDDALMSYDYKRKENAISLLKEVGEGGRQVLYYTKS